MALLPDRLDAAFLSDDDREFNEHRANLQRIILNHTGSKRALYDEVVILLHSVWYQRCIEKRQFTQREHLQKLKKRAGCCYTLCCAPWLWLCCCGGSQRCRTVWKCLFVFWIVLGFAVLVYFTVLRLFHGQ